MISKLKQFNKRILKLNELNNENNNVSYYLKTLKT